MFTKKYKINQNKGQSNEEKFNRRKPRWLRSENEWKIGEEINFNWIVE